MKSQYITILDFVLLPFVLAIIYAFAYYFRNKHYPIGHSWRKYFIPGLTFKLFGAIFIGLVYQYYYGGGDTFNYFYHAREINKALDRSFVDWLDLVLHNPSKSNPRFYQYISRLYWYDDTASYTVAAITAVVSLVVFNTYLPTAALFAFISFSGIWALFRTFAKAYPKLAKPIAYATLFIPSTFVWGSGVFKDTWCMFALGWLTFASFKILVERKFSFKSVLTLALSFYLIYKIKIYILLAFIPAISLWILFIYTQKIRGRSSRIAVKIFAMLILTGSSVVLLSTMGSALGRYSLSNIERTSLSTRGWIEYASGDEGSSYNLGDFSPTLGGMLSKMPAAVIVTFFRPFPWEARKVIVMLSALEALLFIWLTLKVISSVGIKKSVAAISADPTIQFCLIFSLIFAFAVGISSYNFGALSRYKIPCLPFFALSFILIYYHYFDPKKKILPFI